MLNMLEQVGYESEIKCLQWYNYARGKIIITNANKVKHYLFQPNTIVDNNRICHIQDPKFVWLTTL